MAFDGAKNNSSAYIFYAGGGSGGHISPGLAIAEAVAARDSTALQQFICSRRTIDARMLTDANVGFSPISAAPFGSRPGSFLRFIKGWQRSQKEVSALIEQHRPAALIALGGFVAAPAARCAQQHGISVILINLDSVPGKANRLAARWADMIVTVCDTPTVPDFATEKVAMPLRMSALASTFGDQTDCKRSLGLDANLKTLIVTGASQGSQSLNELCIGLVEAHREALDGWQVYHLPGSGQDHEHIAKQYAAADFPAVVAPFQSEMGLVWGAADLAISRAGANSVAEIAINCVPTMFLPYPFHHDRHQYDNALPLQHIGGVIVLDDHVDPEKNLAKHGRLIADLLQDDDHLSQARNSLEEHRPQNGAEEVAAIVESVIAGRR